MMHRVLMKTIKSKSQLSSVRFLSQVQHQFANISDPVQKSLMSEKCILVDENDNIVGSDSKLDCHAVAKDGSIKLHRAFSVFLFNTSGQLLMQERSEHKVTFPQMWTNTCCSHPLFLDSETNGIEGIKTAAKRRLEYELGITEIQPDDLDYLTRIHYFSLSDDKWGEHEIDYILFAKKDVKVEANKNEIRDIKYMSLDDLSQINKSQFTPWFRLILESKLPIWWSSLDRLQKYREHSSILRLQE